MQILPCSSRHSLAIPSTISFLQTMIRFWPGDNNQLTPRAEKNPFDDHHQHPTHHNLNYVPSPGPSTPTTHPLLAINSPFIPSSTLTSSAYGGGGGSVTSDLTPTSSLGGFPAAQPTTQLSLHAPVFNMQQPPPGHRNKSLASILTSSPSTPPQTTASKGQIHVKLIQARALNVRTMHARPYVVVQFEQNEFVGRDPTDETDKEVKGTAISRQPSSNAVSALGAIGSKAAALDASKKGSRPNSTNPSPSSSVAPKSSLPPVGGASNGLFGRLSAHNPIWKHEVSLYALFLTYLQLTHLFTSDVTSEESLITFNVYDRAVSDQGFLGTVQIKPALVHDHTVDQWYK
jgi:hypothetical protein